MTVPKKYGAMLFDPPWEFKVWGRDTGKGRSAESHYPTMSMNALKSMNVLDLALPDCALFMWCCWPSLPEALELGDIWGFEYKTAGFVWAKTLQSAHDRLTVVDNDANWHFGMGYWSRANTEPCLLFTRGKPKRKARNVRQLIIAAIREHSRKPDDVHRRIEQLVDGPYLEAFARRPYPGWDVFGNEVESNVKIEMGEYV